MEKHPSITGLKLNKWYNRKTRQILFGVDGKVNGKWVHICNGGDLYMFNTEHEACQKIKELAKDFGIL